MDKSCLDCKYIIHKKSKKSKIEYGYCKKLKMNLIAVQLDCKLYKKEEIEKGIA